MNIGMLWFDNDTKTDLPTKVARAAAFYEKKYGQAPDLCYVHPDAVIHGIPLAGSIQIRANRSVLPNHLWIGIEERQAK